ncbi:MAG: hypothetical protein ACKVWV_15435 [Planctomycetota bacterium]
MALTPTVLALSAFVGAGVLALCASRVAQRVGAIDDGSDAPARKRQRAPVPLIGGFAIAGSAALALALDGGAWHRAWPAILCAFAVGFVDDVTPRGLSAGWKLAGQAVAGIVLAVLAPDAGPVERAGFVLAAVAAQNALNTFDNADGAAVVLSACGLAFGAPPFAPAWAAACAGFLPFNLRPRPSSARAYLGDSGSHALGLVLLCTPAGRAALLLPLLDLARVAIVRWRAGQAPWTGDLRHLAHRFQRCGLGPFATVLALVVIALPAIVGAGWWGSATAVWSGARATALLFGVAVGATRAGA